MTESVDWERRELCQSSASRRPWPPWERPLLSSGDGSQRSFGSGYTRSFFPLSAH